MAAPKPLLARVPLDPDGRPRQHVVLSFGHEFHLADIKMIPIGLCVSLAGPGQQRRVFWKKNKWENHSIADPDPLESELISRIRISNSNPGADPDPTLKLVQKKKS